MRKPEKRSKTVFKELHLEPDDVSEMKRWCLLRCLPEEPRGTATSNSNDRTNKRVQTLYGASEAKIKLDFYPECSLIGQQEAKKEEFLL